MTDVTGAVMDAATLKILQKAAVLSISSQSEVLSGSQGLKFVAAGTGFSDFDPQGFAHAGNLTQFEVAHADRFILDWTNINAPIADFWAAVKTGNLSAVEAVVFASDDKFDIVGSINGAPPNVYNGLGGDDIFHLNLSLHGAAAVMNGGDGDDTFKLDANFDAATDKVDGGAGFDTVDLSGGSAADLTMGATSLVNVERVVLAPLGQPLFNYEITMNDGNVAKGAVLQIDATGMAGHGSLHFNGAAESDGAFDVQASAGLDIITGGRGADTINGGAGPDTLTGGAGADRFEFSGPFGQDIVKDFAATGTAHDVLQLDSTQFASFQAVLAHAAQVGPDTVITLDATDSITLQKVALASLTATDFLFT